VRIVKVRLGPRSYDIQIGAGLLAGLGKECARLKPGSRCAIISDTNVGPRFGKAAQRALAKAGFDSVMITVPAGKAPRA